MSNSAFSLTNIVGLPAGVVVPFAGVTIPDGWLACDGSAVSRTTYAALFAALGTTYGVGDGSTTFNLPDSTGRVIAGKESTATRLTSGVSGVDGATLGASGGSQSMHQHTHGITDPGHNHARANTLDTSAGSAAAGGSVGAANATYTVNSNTTGISVNNAGSGSSQNVPPTIVMHHIIKV